MDTVPEDHLLLILGDFNARVGSGSSELEKHQWVGVSKVTWEMNESRAVLLSFCALDCLSIMNTCFEKHDVFKYT